MVCNLATTGSDKVKTSMRTLMTDLSALQKYGRTPNPNCIHQYERQGSTCISSQTETIASPERESEILSPDLQENEEWGDSIYQTKSPGACRIYFQNIHGLRTTSKYDAKWNDCLEVMHYYDVDIFGFVETCTNWRNRRLVQKHNRIARQRFPHCHIDYSINKYQIDSDYLPGGALQATTGNWTGRLQRHFHDPHKMGRWTGSQYILNDHQSLNIFTVYRVYKDAPLAVSSSYTQQMLALRERFGEDTTSTPRKQVLVDLIQYINELQLGSHDHLLIMIDANEALGEDDYGLQSAMQQLQLVDLFTLHHSQVCNIATYNRSKSHRIDYIVGSKSLLPHITKCGYLPFAKGIESDHRGVFIDFGPTLTSGDLHLNIPYERKVGLTTCKKELYEYKQQVVKKFFQHDIPARAQKLYDEANTDFDDDHQFLQALNKLDDEVTNIVLEAEKQCCHIKPAFEWSIEIKQASLLIKYWQLKYHYRNKKRKIGDTLQRIYDQLSTEHQVAIDLAPSNYIRANLRLARKAKKELYLQHRQRKQEGLHKRYEADALYSGRSVDQVKAQHQQQQTNNRLFRYLRTVYPKQRGRGITSIAMPATDRTGQPTTDPLTAVTWRKEHDPQKITKALMQRNINHFGQSAHSPFASDPLHQVFGYRGTNLQSTSLIHDPASLSAVLQDTSIHKGASAILHTLADQNYLPPLSDVITYEEFWQAFRKWDERTSTSPSNRHLGHYKSLMTSDGQDATYDEDNVNPSSIIKRVYYHIAMAAVYSANTLNRWARSSTMMLEKTPGQPRIHRLRVIHIYEADYNLLLKILWARKLVRHSNCHNALHSSQAGSRPDHRCIDVVLRKEMNYQYSRFTRTPLATVDNDAKACYDRILCNLAMMISQYHGMSNRACKFHSKTLERMRFTIRTAGGDSKEYYRHSPGQPIHGSGQGSCASPSLWLHISSILLRIHAMMAQGMTRFDVTKGIFTHISAEGFVDDISLFVNNPTLHMEALQMLVAAISNDINMWQDLLAGSGGKLELEKCFYYIIAWKFNKFGDAIPQTMEDIANKVDCNIKIRDPDTDRLIPLRMKQIHEHHKTLGVLKTMSGNEQDQLQGLLHKSDSLATSTALGQLTRFQARRAYTSIYMPAMLYSLVATSLSETDLNKVQSKALRQFLPAMGYEPTFPRAVVHGPRAFGGINLGHLYTEMCVAKIGALIAHLQAKTGLGDIMLANINWLQLHSGLSQSIFQDTAPVSYLQMNWFVHLREFLHTINGKLLIPGQWKILLERRGDQALMDKISKSERLTAAEKRIFNNWRLYLQVSTLSDITSADGNHIQNVYWLPRQPRQDISSLWRQSKHNWPIQEAPDETTFKIWRKGLRTVFSVDQTGCLRRPLGDWLVTPSNSHNQWKQYIDTTTNTLYVRHEANLYMAYPVDITQTSRNKLIYDSTPDDMVDGLPETCVPITAVLSSTSLIIYRKRIHGPIVTNIPTTVYQDFDAYLFTLPTWRKELLIHWQTVSLQNLQMVFSTQTELLVATDGSHVQETGESAFGVVIGNYDQELMTTLGNAPGEPSLHSSFRSELYGILAACVLITEVTKFSQFQVPDGMFLRFFVDNKGAIDRIQRHRHQPLFLGEYLAADIDVELQILEELKVLQSLRYNIPPIQHVKSHQDDHMAFENLSRQAQLNVLADQLATSMHAQKYATIDYSMFPTTTAQLVINEFAITSKYKESVRTAFHSQELRDYYCHKFQWQQDTVDDIWWTPFSRAICKLSHSERQQIQKFNVRRLHTNNRAKLFNSTVSDTCKHCPMVEDNDHIIRCHHCSQSRQACRTEWQVKIMEYLSEEHTPPSVRIAILTAITSWIACEPIPNIRDICPDGSENLIQAYEAQTTIGWDNFFRGKFSCLWEQIITDHIKRSCGLGRHTTATTWAASLINILWLGVLDIWNERNREEHGTDYLSQHSKEKERLLFEAAYLQGLSPSSSSPDAAWFQKSIVDLSHYSVYSLKAWVRNARTIVRLRYQEQKSRVDSPYQRTQIHRCGGRENICWRWYDGMHSRRKQ